jgi:hypothetical protein
LKDKQNLIQKIPVEEETKLLKKFENKPKIVFKGK